MKPIVVIAITIVIVLESLRWRAVSARASELARIRKDLSGKVAAALACLAEAGQEVSSVSSVISMDVDGDGSDELLVQQPAGGHGTSLKVLAWRGHKFYVLATLQSDNPAGFEFGDFDEDGQVEIKSEETNWAAGVPYVHSKRSVVVVRWDGERFARVL